jgi:hypothetical protein
MLKVLNQVGDGVPSCGPPPRAFYDAMEEALNCPKNGAFWCRLSRLMNTAP